MTQGKIAQTAQVSLAGQQLTMQSEGLRLTAYRDVGGVLTIGYGHTGPDVHEGLTITLAQADAQLTATLAAIAATIWKNTRRELLQQELDAMADFAFNLGEHALLGSTLWVLAMAGAPAARIELEFGRWVYTKVNGRQQALPSLTRRRAAESKLYLTGDWQ